MKRKFIWSKILGTTLVELMVGLSMGAIATAALIGIYSSGASTTKAVNDTVKMSEDVRIAMQELSNDISRAGTTSCSAAFPVGLYSFEGTEVARNIVGYTVDGDPYCFTDEGGTDCAFFDENAHLRKSTLTCGADHLARLGITGYGDATHWCAKAKAAITNGTALRINPARTVVNLVNDTSGLNEWWENGILYVNAPIGTASNSFFPTKIASSNNLLNKIISIANEKTQLTKQSEYAFFRQKIVDYLLPNETNRLNNQTDFAKRALPKDVYLAAIQTITPYYKVINGTYTNGNTLYYNHLNGITTRQLSNTITYFYSMNFALGDQLTNVEMTENLYLGTNISTCRAEYGLRYSPDIPGRSGTNPNYIVNCDSNPFYSISGTISGLPTGTNLFVAVNGIRVLFTQSSSTAILFQTGIPNNTVYTITAVATGFSCSVTNRATGTLTANVTDAQVTCKPLLKLQTKVSGLGSGSVNVSVNGILAKTFTTNSSTPVLLKDGNADGSNYAVTASSTTKSCEVVNANGTFAGVDVNNIEVNCTPLPTSSHTNTASNKFGKAGLLVQYAHIFSNVNSIANQANNVTLTEDIPAGTAGKTVAINSSSPANSAFVISNCSGAHVFNSTANTANVVNMPAFSRPYFAGDSIVAPLVSKFYFVGGNSDPSCPKNNLCVTTSVPNTGTKVTNSLVENVSAMNYSFIYKNMTNSFPSSLGSFRAPSATERPVGVIIDLTYSVNSASLGLGGNQVIDRNFSTAVVIDSAR